MCNGTACFFHRHVETAAAERAADVVAFLFMSHGMQKILAFPAPASHPVNLASLGGVAGLLELFGGALLLVGLFTRPVAFILSGEMAFAYFMAHAPQGFWPLLNRGELAVA